jgi:hypothetical protein
MLQVGRLRVRFLMRSLDFFKLPNSSIPNIVMGWIQRLTEMTTRKLAGGKGRPARKADNFTAICESIF